MHEGKVADYLAAGSRIVWVVNPVREDVLPGFAGTIAEIFEG